ncbi:TIGR02301 family protein [Terrarubrum flagellatum]|uniref:TIGR02301 family protein n=1 Tax=Terrirubrum flagellatum TaxID=2895980 RepID=UPI003144EFD3
MRRATAFAILAALLAAAPSAAQQRRPATPPPTQPAPEPDLAPPYEPQLLRLAEIIGALSFLRDLCGMKDGEAWRAKMAALVATEGVTPERKERLAGAFNRGFRGYQQTYRACTPPAALTIDRFVDEGGKLSRELANRFSG